VRPGIGAAVGERDVPRSGQGAARRAERGTGGAGDRPGRGRAYDQKLRRPLVHLRRDVISTGRLDGPGGPGCGRGSGGRDLGCGRRRDRSARRGRCRGCGCGGDDRGRGRRRGLRRGRGRRRRHRDSRPGRRSRGDGSRGRATDRQEQQRIEVRLRVDGRADPEMDVGLGNLGVAARPDGPDHVAFGDDQILGDRDRTEMREGDGEPVCGLDRQALARGGNGAGERHRPARGREDVRARRAGEVDASMLAAAVGVGGVEDERLQDRAVDRPGPRARRGRDHQRDQQGREKHSTHGLPPFIHRVRQGRRPDPSRRRRPVPPLSKNDCCLT
jgi:hypothetical protein